MILPKVENMFGDGPIQTFGCMHRLRRLRLLI